MRLARDRQDDLFFLAVLLLGCCAWITTVNQIGWLDDDHWDVYGQPARPVPSFYEMICDAGLGVTLPHPTIERILALPFCGYGGLWLGPELCHLLLGVMHLACGGVFYLVLRKLRWEPAPSLWAAALFLVSPWITEPIFWWTAGTLATPSTLLGLCAVLSYLRWSREKSRRFLALTLFLTFASNCWYELWLAIPLLFLGIELYERKGKGQRWGEALKQSIKGWWPTILPGMLWAILVRLSFPASYPARHLALPPHRLITVLLSVQLRVLNWFSRTPWHSAIKDGLMTLATPLGIVFLVLTASLVALLWSSAPQRKDVAPPIPLLPALLLGWLWFMSARIVLVLQGGIDVETRHNYPADMGCMIALIAILDSVARGSRLRSVSVRVFLSMALIVGMITTAGIGRHFAERANSKIAVAGW